MWCYKCFSNELSSNPGHKNHFDMPFNQVICYCYNLLVDINDPDYSCTSTRSAICKHFVTKEPQVIHKPQVAVYKRFCKQLYCGIYSLMLSVPVFGFQKALKQIGHLTSSWQDLPNHPLVHPDP